MCSLKLLSNMMSGRIVRHAVGSVHQHLPVHHLQVLLRAKQQRRHRLSKVLTLITFWSASTYVSLWSIRNQSSTNVPFHFHHVCFVGKVENLFHLSNSLYKDVLSNYWVEYLCLVLQDGVKTVVAFLYATARSNLNHNLHHMLASLWQT